MSYPENLSQKNEAYYRSEAIVVVKSYSPYGDGVDPRGQLLEEAIFQKLLTAHVRGRETALTRQVLLVAAFCTIEQWCTLAAFIWLIGWQGWNPWWMVLGMVLVMGASPSAIMKVLKIGKHSET